VRPRGLALGVALAFAGVGACLVAACTDLFHTTGDIRTACEIDAATPGCATAPDAGADGGDDFCAWPRGKAQATAKRVCAWLGACEGPLGGNAFGACTVQARLAFDCAANPDHPVRGAARDRWACLASAASCDGVHRCFLPEPVRCASGGDYTTCVDGGSARVECVGSDAAARTEDCALWGQTCVPAGAGASCGPTGASIDCRDAGGACSGDPSAAVRACEPDGGQGGIDCADNGAQACNAFGADGGPAWAACVPQVDGGAPCAPTLATRCTNGVAALCPTGTAETIDCAALLDNADACAGTSLAPPFDWTSACSVASACPADACDGSVLTACARGAAFGVDCNQVGLGPCRIVATDEGASMHAACAPP
jgi:hypothetical protein